MSDSGDDDNTPSPDEQGYSQLPMSMDDGDVDSWDTLEPETESPDSEDRIDGVKSPQQRNGDENDLEADGISDVAELAVQSLDEEYQRVLAEPDLNAIVRERAEAKRELDGANSNITPATCDVTDQQGLDARVGGSDDVPEDNSGNIEKDSDQQEQLKKILSKDTVDEVRAIMSSMKMPPPPARFADCDEEDWDKVIRGLQQKQ